MASANPFVVDEAADRYARARPNYHPNALEAAVSMLSRAEFDAGLDLGCGTGMSTAALADRCTFTVGIDAAYEMLRRTQPLADVRYLLAEAERLPLSGGTVEIVVAAAAFHWFQQDDVLQEVKRVLKRGGFFVVYTDWFTGQIRETPDLFGWMEQYLNTYPSPRRHAPFDEELATNHGFEFIGTTQFKTEFHMEMETFSDYLLSQSNALAAIEEGRTTAAELKAFIESATSQWFPATALYEGQVWCSRSLED